MSYGRGSWQKCLSSLEGPLISREALAVNPIFHPAIFKIKYFQFYCLPLRPPARLALPTVDLAWFRRHLPGVLEVQKCWPLSAGACATTDLRSGSEFEMTPNSSKRQGFPHDASECVRINRLTIINIFISSQCFLRQKFRRHVGDSSLC